MTRPDPRTVAVALLSARADDATVCPSEVARGLVEDRDGGRTDWRGAMPAVHAVIDEMVADGSVWLSWKGERLATRSGPYRLHRGPAFPK